MCSVLRTDKATTEEGSVILMTFAVFCMLRQTVATHSQSVHVPRFKCHTVQLLESRVNASRANEIHTITILSDAYLYTHKRRCFDCVLCLALIAFRTSNEAFDVGKKQIRFWYEIEVCWGQFYAFHFDGEFNVFDGVWRQRYAYVYHVTVSCLKLKSRAWPFRLLGNEKHKMRFNFSVCACVG